MLQNYLAAALRNLTRNRAYAAINILGLALRPVLWANVIAWPLAYLCMRHWLDGFAYHIDQSPLVFLGASALALAIALATISGHALAVARIRPAPALRYE